MLRGVQCDVRREGCVPLGLAAFWAGGEGACSGAWPKIQSRSVDSCRACYKPSVRIGVLIKRATLQHIFAATQTFQKLQNTSKKFKKVQNNSNKIQKTSK